MAGVESRRVAGAGGVPIAVHRLGDAPGERPPVIVVHATGFHGRCYSRMAQSLTPEFAVWAVDQRGHGASGKAPDGRYDDWNRFAEDLLDVIDAIEPGAAWGGVGHSLGGAVVLLAEALRPGTFSSLCCYEPVVFPPDWLPSSGEPAHGGSHPVPLAVLARKRRPSFTSRQAAIDNYRSKPPFAAFDRAALEDYVEYGFVDAADGSVTLACVREDEAAVFEAAPGSRVWDRLAEVRPPVAVLAGGDQVDPVARVADTVARQLPRGGLRRFPTLDHFGPMTAPDRVGAVVAAALGADPAQSTIGVTSPG